VKFGCVLAAAARDLHANVGRILCSRDAISQNTRAAV